MRRQTEPANHGFVELAPKIAHHEQKLGGESHREKSRRDRDGALAWQRTKLLGQEEAEKRYGQRSQNRKHQRVGLVRRRGEEKPQRVPDVFLNVAQRKRRGVSWFTSKFPDRFAEIK